MRAQRKALAKHLRKNMTKPEVLLWVRMQNDQLGFRIKRQFCFGTYILDFYCAEARVSIEVDGKDHSFRLRKDRTRDEWLRSQGARTLRVPARVVLKSPEYAAEKVKMYLEWARDNRLDP